MMKKTKNWRRALKVESLVKDHVQLYFFESYYTSEPEMQALLNDKSLMEGIEQGHKDAKKKRGRYV